MPNLYNTLLGANFSTDPAIALKNYLQTNYSLVTPAASSILFDTKFTNMSRPNMLIVKPMTISQQAQTIGASRYSYISRYKIHVYCQGHSAKNNKFLIEQEIERLINGSPSALLSSGIQIISIENFVEIDTGIETKASQGMSADTNTIARSMSNVIMQYDKYVTA